MIKQLLLAAAAASLLAACGSSDDATPAAADAAAPAADAAAPAGDAAAPAAGDSEGVAAVAFKIENATNRTLTHLFISPAAENSWNRDILGDQVAPAGATVDVSIDDGVESCMYDMQARFNNNEGAIDVRGINVCELEGKTVTISEN